MKFLAPEFFLLMLGVLVIAAFYIFIRRRMIVRTGFYNLWLEAAQDLGYINKVRFRKLISILLAILIFSTLVLALTQPRPAENIDKSIKMHEQHTFIIVDTFFETFPYFDHCITLQKLLKIYAEQEIKGKVYFQDKNGFHIRTFEKSAQINWSKHLMFTEPKLFEIIEDVEKHAKNDDKILIVTYNKTFLTSNLTDIDNSILNRMEFLKIPEKAEANKINTDISIENIHQLPAFPLKPEKLKIKVKNYSSNTENVQLIVHPGHTVLRSFEIKAFEEIDVDLSLTELLINFETEKNSEISFKDAVENKNPLYFTNLTHKYSAESGYPMLFEVRGAENINDVRPANNFAFSTLNPDKMPKVAVVGKDADNEYISLLFSIFEESKLLKLVKLADAPEIIIQFGKTTLKLPENAHLVKFEPGISEYDAPSAYFWQKTRLIDAEPLQKFFFSLQKVSNQISGAGEILLDSPGGILAKVTENQGKFTIHFSFSINPENSDFLLRSEIAPAIFSRIIHALTKDKLKVRHKPAYFAHEEISIRSNQYLLKLEFIDFERDNSCKFIDLPKNKIIDLPNPKIPGIFTLNTHESIGFVAINPIRTKINLIENMNIAEFSSPKPKPIKKNSKNDEDKTKYVIILIQIAFLLVITETVLYRLRITE